MKRWIPLLLALLIVVTAWPAAAQDPPPPDLFIGPPVPPGRGVALTLIEERVNVQIEGQLAITRVAQRFRNDSEWALEGEYLFPLPADAAITDMDMTVNGEKLEGQLLRADEATAIYEEIVRQQMDPALLEWLGSGLFRTHIFPIPPGETRLIELEYTQLLTADSGLFEFRFPLRQGSNGARVPNASISVELAADAPLRALYSPSHEVDVLRDGEQAATIGWEGTDVPLDQDFTLYWSVSPEEIDVRLLSFKERGEDGFFLLLAAPPVEPPSNSVVERDVVIVLDVSGSMEGEALDQAKGALTYILDHLNPGDRFDIIAFSSGTRPFAPALQPISEVAAAKRWVSELEAAGSTHIERALTEAMAVGQGAQGQRPFLLLFLTDGLPTAGTISADTLTRLAVDNAPPGTRLFSFGIGYDLDTVLLDGLAANLGGSSAYVRPDQRIDEQVSAFYEKVSAPILAELRLDWGDARVEELVPSPLPDLFAGQQLVLAGRYRAGGPLDLTLSGSVNGAAQRFRYDELRLADDGDSDAAWLPRLWATRKIGTLLRDIRLNGESREAVEEVTALGLRYGIVTPYTTFLVDEGVDLFAPAEERGLAPPPAAAPQVSGEAAVSQSESAADMADSERVESFNLAENEADEGLAETALRVAGNRTFARRDAQWVDTQFTPDMPRQQLLFGSAGYFELAARAPEVAQALSVGVPLIIVVEGTAFQIVADPDLPTPVAVTQVALPTLTARPTSDGQATTVAIAGAPPSATAPAASAASTASPAEPAAPPNRALPLAAAGGLSALLLVGAALWRQRR